MNLASYSARDFDRGAPRWKEAAWWVVKILFFQTAVPWPSALRCALLRLFGAHVGAGVVIRSNVNVSFPWRLAVGDHVWIGEEVMILSLAPVQIESNVCVSQRVFLCTGSHDYRRDNFDLVTREITLASGSWVASQSFVGPGVRVGRSSVVSAGSVVMSNVPDHTLVRGNPAVGVRSLEATGGEKMGQAFPGTH